MKKLLLVILLIFIIIIFSIYGLFITNKAKRNSLKNYNSEYEEYLNKTINGAELATLINKTVNTNEKNGVKKDRKDYYIDNEENSIKIETTILLTEKTYPMEEIYNKGTAEFVKYFTTINFRCTSIEYHEKTGKISKMFFEQVDK